MKKIAATYGIVSGALIAMWLVSGCEIVGPPPERFKLSIYPVIQSELLFTELLIDFYVNLDEYGQVESNAEVIINFGDGRMEPVKTPITSRSYVRSTLPVKHRYESPGEYHITYGLKDGSWTGDTTIFVHKNHTTIGSTEVSELPVGFWQTAQGEYRAVSTTHESSLESTWSMTRLSSSFNLLNSSTMFAGGDSEFAWPEFNVTPAGNLLLTRFGKLVEFSPEGVKVNEVSYPSSLRSTSNHRFADGYWLTGTSNDGVELVNMSVVGSVISDRTIIGRPTSWATGNPVLSTSGDLFVCYLENLPVSGAHHASRLIVYDVALNVKMDKTYDVSFLRLYPAHSGFFFFYIDNQNRKGLGRADVQGNVLWRCELPAAEYDLLTDPSVKVSPFDVNGDAYVFYGNMHGTKIGPSGNIIWQKQFGTGFDRFVSAIYNQDNNFTLLGVRLGDIRKDIVNGFEPDDMVFAQVDKNGNLIDH